MPTDPINLGGRLRSSPEYFQYEFLYDVNITQGKGRKEPDVHGEGKQRGRGVGEEGEIEEFNEVEVWVSCDEVWEQPSWDRGWKSRLGWFFLHKALSFC